MNRSSSADFADADGEDPVEERVLRRGRLEPSNEPPVTGKIETFPCGVAPICWGEVVVSRRIISGREFMDSFLSSARPCARSGRTRRELGSAGCSDETIPVHVTRVKGLRGSCRWDPRRGVRRWPRRRSRFREAHEGCAVKAGRGAEVVCCGVDGLAASSRRDHLRRAMPQAKNNFIEMSAPSSV
jgi:hypothetical protein